MSILVTQDSLLSGTEKEDIKNIISLEIINDNLYDQINSIEQNNFSTTDYIDIFNNQYNYCLKSFSDDYESIEELHNMKDDFYDYVLKLIYEKFGFTLEFSGELIKEEINNIIYVLYKLFILNWKENVETYYINRVIDEYKEIVNSYKDRINYKDFMFQLIKKDFISKDFPYAVFCVDRYYKEMEFDYFEDIFSYIIKGEEEEEDNIIISRTLINLEDTSDISVDIDIIKDIIINTLNNNYSIILSTRKLLMDHLKKLDGKNI